MQDGDSHVTRHKPEGLESLCRTTKFSRKELQILYRGFKQVSPSTVLIFTGVQPPVGNLTTMALGICRDKKFFSGWEVGGQQYYLITVLYCLETAFVMLQMGWACILASGLRPSLPDSTAALPLDPSEDFRHSDTLCSPYVHTLDTPLLIFSL